MEDQGHQAMWPQMIAALAAIDGALGLPEDGCNSLAQTLAAIKKLKAGWQDYRFEYDVRIVQPGLSRKAIGEEGLHLLAGVETYLLETRGMRLRVIGSD